MSKKKSKKHNFNSTRPMSTHNSLRKPSTKAQCQCHRTHIDPKFHKETINKSAESMPQDQHRPLIPSEDPQQKRNVNATEPTLTLNSFRKPSTKKPRINATGPTATLNSFRKPSTKAQCQCHRAQVDPKFLKEALNKSPGSMPQNPHRP